MQKMQIVGTIPFYKDVWIPVWVKQILRTSQSYLIVYTVPQLLW